MSSNLAYVYLTATYIMCDLKYKYNYAFDILLDSTLIQIHARPLFLAIHQQSQLPQRKNDVIRQNLGLLTEKGKCADTARF